MESANGKEGAIDSRPMLGLALYSGFGAGVATWNGRYGSVLEASVAVPDWIAPAARPARREACQRMSEVAERFRATVHASLSAERREVLRAAAGTGGNHAGVGALHHAHVPRFEQAHQPTRRGNAAWTLSESHAAEGSGRTGRRLLPCARNY